MQEEEELHGVLYRQGVLPSLQVPELHKGWDETNSDNETETNDVKRQAGHTGVKKTGNNFSNHNMEKRSRPVKHENVLENSESEEEVDIFSPK